MKFSFVLVLIFFTSIKGDDFQACKNDFQQFLNCAKTQFSTEERKAIKDDMQSKANACFQNSGCTIPTPNNDQSNNHLAKFSNQMPDSVKKCMKRKVLEKFGAKLNSCLSRKGFQNVNFTELAETVGNSGVLGAHGGNGGDDLHGMFNAQMAIAKGVDKCCVDKYNSDTNKVKPLEQCLHDIKKSIKPRVCNDLKSCENGISPRCKKQGQDIRKAVCECMKEKEKEIAGKLAELGKQSKVPIQDVIHTFVDDQDISGITKDIEACYAENNEQEPPMLKLITQVVGGGGGRGLGKLGNAKSLDGRQVTILSDMMTLDANDISECQPC